MLHSPDALRPPARYDDARLDSYVPQTNGQAEARDKARRFVRLARVRYGRPSWMRLFQRDDGLRGGLYLVGPVGTGKTHLLASIWHALASPDDGAKPVACAYTHSSALLRAVEPPEVYADRIAEAARVLCLDEVELDDPAGEVRLIAVLKALRERGVTLAATSNAEPENFVSARQGRERLERFISEEFERQYHVVFVGGDDFRQGLEKEGRAWVGDAQTARAAMRRAFEAAPEPKQWLAFDELVRLTTEVERTRLTRELASARALFIDGIDVTDTDAALRLLRVADDLYGLPDPPTLFFTSATTPADWFAADGRRGVEAAIAEKFTRTTSRLTALAEVEHVGESVRR
ncbi:AFG1/ZapE family ATPase [Rubrivirga sp.]|uniref:AFG1/ZapE family ATPase n=1 Tax=Rubrivirga sp. TaxID=1885344 RepID=UPI003B523E97